MDEVGRIGGEPNIREMKGELLVCAKSIAGDEAVTDVSGGLGDIFRLADDGCGVPFLAVAAISRITSLVDNPVQRLKVMW